MALNSINIRGRKFIPFVSLVNIRVLRLNGRDSIKVIFLFQIEFRFKLMKFACKILTFKLNISRKCTRLFNFVLIIKHLNLQKRKRFSKTCQTFKHIKLEKIYSIQIKF